ncbi:hypothetical protein F1B92_08005 [Campylobacter sp. FMV-PI01]|uniref:Class I SAM-dependent methyltransferase n=1 Tax=Campylobacter portucalensis TaxID=2608384 RepID=A0A6L5WN61_9BACT|nr:hypothetical protein [Campylobacter portucalensis]MSN97101.1 hypothetical protein [Campylobacter portucalensis]
MQNDLQSIIKTILIYPDSSLLLIKDENFQFRDALLECIENCDFLEENIDFKFLNPSFLFDIVILGVDDLFRVENHCEILEKIYRNLKKAGNLIIVSKYDERYDYYKYEDILLNLNYVAINEVLIKDNHTLICSKKMHGWGG